MRLFANANYDFLGHRRLTFSIGAILLTASLVMALFWQFNQGSWLNYGVDFTGGTLVQVEFETETNVAEVRDVVLSVSPGTGVTRFGGENEYLVRVPEYADDEETDIAESVVTVLGEHYGEGAFEVVRTEAVGAKVGGELQLQAALAVLLSFLFTLVYLAFRFEWRFGLAAIIAVLHDVFITLGIISAFQIDVSLTTVAALLTIVGYSLNDTIVIFDRIRENLKLGGRREESAELMNRSINETLPRTVMTSMTTLFALLALFVLGGSIIRDFALILLIGVVLGTHSSIFVASPALYEIQKRWPPKERQRRRPGGRRRARPKRAGVPA